VGLTRRYTKFFLHFYIYSRFPCKIEIHLKRVCHKVSLFEYSQRQSCKAFTGLSIRASMVWRDVLLKVNFLFKAKQPLARERMLSMRTSN